MNFSCVEFFKYFGFQNDCTFSTFPLLFSRIFFYSLQSHNPSPLQHDIFQTSGGGGFCNRQKSRWMYSENIRAEEVQLPKAVGDVRCDMAMAV